MKDIVLTSSGEMWREVESVDEALRVGQATKTAFGVYFKMERERGVTNRYFALGDEFKVIGRVPPDSGESEHSMGPPKIFVAHSNANPFPTYEREIAELARGIGTQITADHYPYRKSNVDRSEQRPEDSESPGP